MTDLTREVTKAVVNLYRLTENFDNKVLTLFLWKKQILNMGIAEGFELITRFFYKKPLYKEPTCRRPKYLKNLYY